MRFPVLRQSILFMFLLPVFFVLHALQQYYGFLHVGDAGVMFVKCLLGIVVAFAIVRPFTKNNTTPAIIVFLGAIIFLYWAYIYNWCRHLFGSSFMTRVPVILILLLMAGIAISFAFAKASVQLKRKTLLFLNLLLLLLILTDAALITWKAIQQKDIPHFPRLDANVPGGQTTGWDVYFILMDEYPSTAVLRDNLHYDNSSMENYLTAKGFSVQRQSHSNYNYTAFSMSSMLNMDYILSLPKSREVTEYDYLQCVDMVRGNRVTTLFSKAGHIFRNYSVFNIGKKPSLLHPSFFGNARQNVENATLYNRLIAPRFSDKAHPSENMMQYNEKVFSLLSNEAKARTTRPRFIYAHLMLPHEPYYFDSLGKRSNSLPVTNTERAQRFVYNVAYANTKLVETIDTILHYNGDHAVILLMGDHGFRKLVHTQDKRALFGNLNAIYFPDRDYAKIKNTTTPVNMFRLLSNKLLSTSYPLLKDTSILLKEKGSNDPL